jgi:integrase/recombinase XerD
LENPSEDRITPDLVKAFVENLIAVGNKKATILDRIQELQSMALVLAPTKCFRFLKDFEARIRARMQDQNKPDTRFVTSDELFSLGFQLMEGASLQSNLRLQAIDFRDGLIIALLALRPMRRKNFAALKLRDNIFKRNGVWRIVLQSYETKTHAYSDVEWPSDLTASLDAYLDLYRPALMARRGRWQKAIGDALWISSHGSALTEMAFYQQVTKRTKEQFGKSINPHQFRHIAASTMADECPEHVRIGASILGHSSFQTTENYYIQGQLAQAHGKFVEHMLAIRQRAKNEKIEFLTRQSGRSWRS